MAAPTLKIFSYLPNPRVWKALIAAEYCGLTIDVVGDKPKNLSGWLWDFNARELNAEEQSASNPHARAGRRGFNATLYKTDEFLQAHPFGTVPAAFSPDGEIGIFESNSILRAVARCGQGVCNLYGDSVYAASRIDSFLDAGLVFAREAQVYLLAEPNISEELYDRMAAAYAFYLSGIEQALTHADYLAGESLSIADIAFACDLGQFSKEQRLASALDLIAREPVSLNLQSDYPKTTQHLRRLCGEAPFQPYADSLLRDIASRAVG